MNDDTIFDLAKAEKWAANADEQIPLRKEFFEEFARQMNLLADSTLEVIEIGSGPGFLAKHILSGCNVKTYSLLDLSDSMHAIARKNLHEYTEKLRFFTRDLASPIWNKNLGDADFAVTMQTMHELNDKNKAPHMLRQISETIRPGGILLLCDLLFNPNHLANDPNIYMTLDEHEAALKQAGFKDVKLVKSTSLLGLFSGAKDSE